MSRRSFAIGCGSVVVVLLLVAGCGMAYVSAELPAGDHPAVDFRSPEISAARAAVIPELEAQLDGMERRFGVRPVGDRISIDRCERGFDDFTRRDQYAYACRMGIVELIPVGEPFRQEASRLGEALLEGDCPDGTDTDRELAEALGDPEQLDGSTGDCTPGIGYPGPSITGWVAAKPTLEELDLALAPFRIRCRVGVTEYARCNLGEFRQSARSAQADAEWLAIVEADETYYLVAWECDWPASWFNDICRNESHPRVR
jgi:hypothetical protein